jgi:hypothetical protein
VVGEMQRSSIVKEGGEREKKKPKMMLKTKNIKREIVEEAKKEHTYKKETRLIFLCRAFWSLFLGYKKKNDRNL